MPITHIGSFTNDSVNDILDGASPASNVALTASGTMPANALTGGPDVTLVSTTNAPGTITTRTAQQMFADMQAQIGNFSLVGFQYNLRITHSGTGTLTLAAGTGVTFGTGTYTIPTNTFRDFSVTVTNAGAFTFQTTGVGTWS